MHEPLLALAALPAPTKACGIPLKTYSLGHELFLIRECNPFSLGGKVFADDLFRAILICSQDFKGAQTISSSWLYLPLLWLIKRRVEKCNLPLQIQAFREYRQAGILEFRQSDIMHPGEAKPRTPGTPPLLRLHEFMCLKYRLTLEQAWDFPFGEAKMRWQCYWEQKGGVEVYNEDNAEIDGATTEEGAK